MIAKKIILGMFLFFIFIKPVFATTGENWADKSLKEKKSYLAGLTEGVVWVALTYPEISSTDIFFLMISLYQIW